MPFVWTGNLCPDQQELVPISVAPVFGFGQSFAGFSAAADAFVE